MIETLPPTVPVALLVALVATPSCHVAAAVLHARRHRHLLAGAQEVVIEPGRHRLSLEWSMTNLKAI